MLSTLTVWSGVARADLASLYIQGFGGLSGASLKEINVGEGTSSMGSVFGGEVGAKFMFLNGYVSLDDYTSRGTVTRVVLNFMGGVGFAGFNLTGRAGMGLMIEKDGVFDGMALGSNRTGATARAGVALDYGLSYGLYVGAGLDGEFYALKPTDSGVSDTSFRTGADIMLSLHVGFALGL